MKRTALFTLLFAAPMLAYSATDVGSVLACEMSATEFFTPLVHRKVIEDRPYSVEDSISYFRPVNMLMSKTSGGLLIYGMQVDSVFGYARGQIFFRRGPGTEPQDVFGFVVKESIANVQAHLASKGVTKALTSRVSTNLTAISCEGI